MKTLSLSLILLTWTYCLLGQTTDCKILKDAFVMRDGKMYTIDKDGIMTPMSADVDLSNGTKLMKNGEFKTSAGVKSKLKNGEVITKKGDMLLLSEQVIKMEGIFLKDGKAWTLKDGTASPLIAVTDFGNGMQCTPDGQITLKDGSQILLSEGDLVTNEGSFIVRKENLMNMEGVVMKNGKPMKWDNGKWVALTTDFTLSATGAKISPAGVLTTKEGNKITLREGEVVGPKGELATYKSEFLYNGYFLRAGKMMYLENGAVKPVSTEINLPNGYKITPDGILVLSAADKLPLRESDFITTKGELLYVRGALQDDKSIADRKTTDHYIFRDGQMMLVKNGEPQILTTDITLPNGAKLLKHGHVLKKDGSKHILKNGEKLDIEGNFIIDKSKQDYDEKNHIVMKMGKMILVKDGKESPMTQEMLLPDWSKIYPDGTHEKPNGAKTKLKEGERFNMEGEPMPKINTGYTGAPATTNANNTTTASTSTTPANTPATATPSQTTIIFKGGKMLIQTSTKEIPMTKERILNNGNKITVDGTVVKKDGTVIKLKEGDKIDYNTGEFVK